MSTTWAEFSTEFVKNTNKARVDVGDFHDRMVNSAAQSKNDFDTTIQHLPEQSLEFANLINATVGGFTDALSQTIPAFKEGRNKEGAAGLIQMISSLTPMMGALGPASAVLGGLISAALGIVSSILGAFEDQRKTLAGEIRDELRHLRAQDVHDELVAAMGDLERAYGPMQEIGVSSRTWEQMQSGWINMFEGNATHQLNFTRSWLEKGENQTNPEWPLIFDCFWHVVDLRLLVFAVMVAKLQGGEAVSIGAMALRERRERDRAFARQIYPVAVNRGTLWHIGNDRDVYERHYTVAEASNDAYTICGNGKKADVLTVGPITKNLFALDKGSGQIWAPAQGVIHGVKGGSDLWAMPEPNEDGPAGERLVVVKNNGKQLESFVISSKIIATTTNIQGNTNNIRQFRSVEIGGSVRYIFLGAKGKIYSGQPHEGKLGDTQQLTEWIDLNYDLYGLSIGRNEQLSANLILAYSDKIILRRQFPPAEKFKYPNDDAGSWKAMDLPSEVKGQKITFATASLTGNVLACFDNKLWVWIYWGGQGQIPGGGLWVRPSKWQWAQEKKGSMKVVYEEPIQGFDKYSEFWKAASTEK
jgi:hypothetical protein